MFVVACPKCEKNLNLPDSSRGKHVRCAGCQEIVLAVVNAGVSSEARPRQIAPPAARPIVHPRYKQPIEEPVNPVVPDAVPGLACANCEADAVVELPPSANSRRPGFICAMCRTEMRQPGGMSGHYAAVVLGAIIVLLGLGLIVVAFGAKQGRDKLVGGGAAVAVLGAVVAGWSFRQTRLPVPLGAEAQPSRFGFWFAIVAIGLLAIAGGVFGLMSLAGGHV